MVLIFCSSVARSLHSVRSRVRQGARGGGSVLQSAAGYVERAEILVGDVLPRSRCQRGLRANRAFHGGG
jgi:hypothetical protein